MADEQQLYALQTAINCYLSSLSSAGNAIAEACPEIGGLYRHRLTRLRARLAFDTSVKAMEASCDGVEQSLREFGARASTYNAQHGIQLRAAVGSLEEIVRSLAQRQDFYGARLRQFAGQMQTAPYPLDENALREVVVSQVAGLLSCVESMSHETQSLLGRMNQELAAVERRIQESEITDGLTGLMNRREIDRQIEKRRAASGPPVLLLFQITGEINDEVMKQVGNRLAVQFRHNDLVARWDDTEFMVLFNGPSEVAHARSAQIIRWVAGNYLLESGASVDVGVDLHFMEPELITA
jgi:GGDEF domain-containing protein